MDREFVAASSEYLEIDSAPVTATPFTLACWILFDGVLRDANITAFTPTTNQWHHAAGVYASASDRTIYLTASDTATGDAELVGIEIKET